MLTNFSSSSYHAFQTEVRRRAGFAATAAR